MSVDAAAVEPEVAPPVAPEEPEPVPPAAVAPASTVIDITALLPLIERGEPAVVIGPDGKPAAALVPVDWLVEHLDLREDIEDGLAIDAALAEDGESVPLDEMLAKYDL